MTMETPFSSSIWLQDNTPKYTTCGGTLHELNDGHIPETYSKNSQYIRYKEMDDNNAVVVHVYDNALPSCIVDRLYDITVAEGQPWGTYVTMDQVRDYWNESSQTKSWNQVEQSQERLSVHAVAHFVDKMTSNPGTTATLPSTSTHDCSTLFSLPEVHGVAVWALASDSTNVEYHIDYAERLRYEHNVLAAPIWAGTLQCTSNSIKGGQFAVNLQGMNHYERHGYKGNKSGEHMGGWSQPPLTDHVHHDIDTGWITIPYRYNRMIGHSGHLPHLSAPFEVEDGCYRVIVGFNVFRNDVGPYVSQAPEHSRAFRRRIQCHRALLSQSNKKNISLENIRQNKALTKLLVLAKREKIKNDLKRGQQRLDRDLQKILETNGSMSVEALMNRFGRTDGEWPTSIDVQVHIQGRVADGTLISSDSDVSLESTIQLNPL